MTTDNNTPKSETQLRLTCLVTGRSRPTTQTYLENKAKRLNANPADVSKNYICREAMVLLNAGKTHTEVRTELNITSEAAQQSTVDAAVRFNGKKARSTSEV